ncbi:MAG TPA: DNA adenine methylase [Ilumatobacteraceae bacterium]
MSESPDYLTRQLITCLGNKRALLGPIDAAVATVKERLGTDRLRILDGFSGSGVVSRLFKQHASSLVVNDLEAYARVVSECYLRNASTVDSEAVHAAVTSLNHAVEHDLGELGLIARLYAPRDDANIEAGERAFYTRDNARRLDRYRTLIEDCSLVPNELLLAPLLAQASVHANTSGVFKGFYKDAATGRGKFGGSGAASLARIRGAITLAAPVLSRHECDYEIFQTDTNQLIDKVGGFDLAYFDPPYNEHPYGSNYFMLNLLVDYVEPTAISRVSGIPLDWQRSRYNLARTAWGELTALIEGVDARFVLLSFNDEGFVSPAALQEFLRGLGTVDTIDLRYNTFRGGRNLKQRSAHVTEHLFLLEKQ